MDPVEASQRSSSIVGNLLFLFDVSKIGERSEVYSYYVYCSTVHSRYLSFFCNSFPHAWHERCHGKKAPSHVSGPRPSHVERWPRGDAEREAEIQYGPKSTLSTCQPPPPLSLKKPLHSLS